MSAYYSNYANSDPSVAKLAKVDREGKPYQIPSWQVNALEFEATKTQVAAVNLAVIPAAAIAGGFVELTGTAGAVSMALPVMSTATQVSTDLVPNLLNLNMQDLKGVTKSSSTAYPTTGTGLVRGIKFLISNQNDNTVTITASADIVVRGLATIATTRTVECIIYAVRDSAGTLTYVFTIVGGQN